MWIDWLCSGKHGWCAGWSSRAGLWIYHSTCIVEWGSVQLCWPQMPDGTLVRLVSNIAVHPSLHFSMSMYVILVSPEVGIDRCVTCVSSHVLVTVSIQYLHYLDNIQTIAISNIRVSISYRVTKYSITGTRYPFVRHYNNNSICIRRSERYLLHSYIY